MSPGGGDPTVLLDTSVVVRYLTDDPPAMAEAAARLVEGGRQVALVPLVLAEAGYVLTSVYGVPKTRAAEALAELVLRRNVSTSPLAKERVVEALRAVAGAAGTSFADALLAAWAADRRLPVATFDRSFPRTGIEVLEP